MKQIKFSHLYKKIVAIGSRFVRLVQVLDINLDELSPAFLAYDTDQGKYTLPKRGKYLMLIFESNGKLMTTLRSAWPPKKAEYYKEAVGETFEIKIEYDE